MFHFGVLEPDLPGLWRSLFVVLALWPLCAVAIPCWLVRYRDWDVADMFGLPFVLLYIPGVNLAVLGCVCGIFAWYVLAIWPIEQASRLRKDAEWRKRRQAGRRVWDETTAAAGLSALGGVPRPAEWGAPKGLGLPAPYPWPPAPPEIRPHTIDCACGDCGLPAPRGVCDACHPVLDPETLLVIDEPAHWPPVEAPVQ